MVIKSLIPLTFLLASLAFGGDDKEQPAPAATSAPLTAQMAFYNFADLINKAERIVLGEIGEKKDGVYTIKAIETLKAPQVQQPISPDAYKRAQELLATGKSSIPEQVKPKGAIDNVNVGVIPVREKVLPPSGTQVVLFLWESETRAGGAGSESSAGSEIRGEMPVYKISHPQCIYDAKVLPQVRAGLVAPRSIADGRFLRDWDEKAAALLAQRKVDENLKKAPGGEPVLGLQLDVVRPSLLLRGDNSFQFATHIHNNFPKEVTVYDGPAISYGVIIRAKDAPPEKALVLRINKYDDIDPVSLNLTSITDFEGIAGNTTLTREHLLDAQKYPDLKILAGDYTLKVFYTNAKNGIKDGLNSPAWTGTMISKEVPFMFRKVGK